MLGLLIHLRENIVYFQVRAWATRIARGKGLISPDDYDLLVVVIKWMLGVVEFDIGSNGSALEESTTYDFLPAHLFVPPSSSEYWTGLVVFVMQMDALTVQSCLMSSDENGHREFLSTIVSNMSDQMEGTRIIFVVFLQLITRPISRFSVE